MLANEVLLYVVLVLAFISEIDSVSREKSILGWSMILVITIAIHYNLMVALAKAFEHIKHLLKRQ